MKVAILGSVLGSPSDWGSIKFPIGSISESRTGIM